MICVKRNLKLKTEPSKEVLCLLQTTPGSVRTYLPIYIHTRTHTHTHIYIYIYRHLAVY